MAPQSSKLHPNPKMASSPVVMALRKALGNHASQEEPPAKKARTQPAEDKADPVPVQTEPREKKGAGKRKMAENKVKDNKRQSKGAEVAEVPFGATSPLQSDGVLEPSRSAPSTKLPCTSNASIGMS